ncbi:MAG: hypothetical protein CVU46_02075 [Chloroflexi bacterium HGW-Chloroflexi-8]|jgi:hypothetical protein|nr:MAG: hypothetical protein CVU46_02075 [Chloroflexi bacterium HGW-Chloroflexi-8]
MNQSTPTNKVRIQPLVLTTVAGLLAALVAIFVFKVAVGLVINYSLIGAIILSHFWMHAGHAGNGQHQEQTSLSNSHDQVSPVPVENERKHGCH